MMSKSEIEQLQRAMDRELQARVSDVAKCGAAILIVFALSMFGPAIGIDAARAADLVALVDPRLLENLAGLGI